MMAPDTLADFHQASKSRKGAVGSSGALFFLATIDLAQSPPLPGDFGIFLRASK